MGKGRSAAPFLPTSRAEMDDLGWAECDVVLVSGDAYVDHPSFGAALVGRFLEGLGLRTGILPQPDWRDPSSILALGVPRLFAGVTGGAMDSMVNHYTSLGRIRTDDAYSEGGRSGMRPDRAVLVYSNLVRRGMPGTPIVLGGIEASLRRLSHYDFWSGKVRRSVILDTRADILVYGMGERQVAEIASRIDGGRSLEGIPGTCTWIGASGSPPEDALVLPSHEEVSASPGDFMRMTLAVEAEANPWSGRRIVQKSDTRWVVCNPPAEPLTTSGMDALYELPYARMPHPRYTGEIPAWTMIRDSITAVRGCAGGCSFCALGLHQGRHIVSRSPGSVIREAGKLASGTRFRGVISDIGGPTANMYGLGCSDPEAERSCRRPSCLFPSICGRFRTSQKAFADLLDGAARVEGVDRVLVASGLRHDLALEDPPSLERIASRHVGGHLKVAPEHFSARILRLMRKPGKAVWRRFAEAFGRASRKAGLEQYLLPYMMAAFPGCSMDDMSEAAAELSLHRLSPRQMQIFLPTPMTLAAAMYFTGLDPRLRPVDVERGSAGRKAQLQVLLAAGNRPGDRPER